MCFCVVFLLQTLSLFLLTQSQFDPYRLLRYDLATAAQDKGIPLLLRRHNVAPGMFLVIIPQVDCLVFSVIRFNRLNVWQVVILNVSVLNSRSSLEAVNYVFVSPT